MKKKGFGKTEDGTETELYTLTNQNGLKASITTYGGIVVSLLVPDKRARLVDIVLGHEALDAYLSDKAYLGAILGRYANRIAGGKFTLNGKNFTVARNNGENHVHGGLKGFNRVVWKAKDISTKQADALDLTYLSPNGEEGYPGNLSARVVYTLTGENELKLDYSATTDRDTVINLTNHTYFNLAGHAAGSILNHELTINADRFTPTDATSIPTGELRSVKGTPFDFSRPTPIGLRVNQDDPQLIYGHGYDQNFVLNQGIGATPALAARVLEPESGRVLEVWTTEPGMQLYCGNFLDGSIHGKGGAVYQRNQGFCLETQHFPDSPNQSSFPSTVLKAGGQYRSTTIFRFLA